MARTYSTSNLMCPLRVIIPRLSDTSQSAAPRICCVPKFKPDKLKLHANYFESKILKNAKIRTHANSVIVKTQSNVTNAIESADAIDPCISQLNRE